MFEYRRLFACWDYSSLQPEVSAVLRTPSQGSAAHGGCQQLDWGKRKIVQARFQHCWEEGWKDGKSS